MTDRVLDTIDFSTEARTTSMTECTALTQPPPDSSSENVIEDILFLNNDFWASEPGLPQPKNNRLNSYEDLSSPESHLSSHRSRVSSGTLLLVQYKGIQ